MRYKCIAREPVHTEGIGVLAPGEEVELSPEQAKIADTTSLLIKIPTKKGKGEK